MDKTERKQESRQLEPKVYQYWFANLKGIGIVKTEALLTRFEHAKGVYEASERELLQVVQLREKEVKQILLSRQNWDLSMEWNKFKRRKIQFITKEMDSYPSRLRNIYRAPYALYVRGKLPTETGVTAAIVGARVCTEYGRKMAYELSERLAKAGVEVISGLANGIDTSGHSGALAAEGKTFAVLGCGVDICYPACNCEIYQKIWKTGGILSEYPPGVEPKAGLFPERNRIISGLSDLVVIMEAREKSGSLITADFAMEQGKDVYALPGRVTDTLSAGCNRLIRQGAGIILSVEIGRASCRERV